MQRLVDGELVDMTAEEIDAVTAEQVASAAASAWRAYQEIARAMLDQSDRTVLRCVEAGIAIPPAWAEYRKSLRVIVSAESGDASQALPVRPDYPAGT